MARSISALCSLIMVACLSPGVTEPSPPRESNPSASSSSAGSSRWAARPPISYPPLTDYGSRATVVADGLRVIDKIGVLHFYDDIPPEFPIYLSEGTEVFLTSGPVSHSGLDWYEVYFSWVPADLPYFTEVTYGWLQAGPEGEDPTNLRIDPPRCPATLTPEILGPMRSLPRIQCLGTDSQTLTGVLQECTSASVLTGKPEWHFPECFDLSSSAAGISGLSVFLPPEIDTAGLRSGQKVKVVGHIDDPAAAQCERRGTGVESLESAFLQQGCRGAFVVSSIDAVH